MLFHRNFMYWIDKRKWKYVFLLNKLALSYPLLAFDSPADISQQSIITLSNYSISIFPTCLTTIN